MRTSFGIWLWAWVFTASLECVLAREWTSADGTKTFEGVLFSYTENTVTVLRKDGQTIAFDVGLLSAADKNYCLSKGPLVESVQNQSLINQRFRIISVGDGGALCEELLPKLGAPQQIPVGLHLEGRNQPRSEFERDMEAADRVTEMKRERSALDSGWKPEVFWIHVDAPARLTDGQIYSANLFFAGAFTYESVSNTNSTVRSFAVHYDDALSILDEKMHPKKKRLPPETAQDDIISSSGTAFAITDRGHLVTNAHVIDSAQKLSVKVPAGRLAAKVLAVDEVNDLAIVKIDSETTPLALSDTILKAGDEVLVAGFPNPELQGTSVKLTRGIISSLKGIKDDARHFQIDAAVQPGNSGGPMLNKDAKVAGIVVARLADAAAIRTTGAIPQNVNYAIKLDYLIPLIKTVDGLWELVSAQKEKSDRTAGEKATVSTFLLINDSAP